MFKAIKHLLFGKKFEFYSSYDLEEAVHHLHRHSQRHKRKPLSWKRTYQMLLIEVEETHKNVYSFQADKEVVKNLFIVVSGQLQRESTGISVTGIARPNRLTLIFPIMFLIGWFSMFISLWGEPISRIMLIIGILAIIALYISMMQSQNKMIEILNTILEKPKKKYDSN